MVAKFMVEKFMVEKIMVHGWNIQCQKIHEVGKFHMALVLKIPELKLGTENSSFLYKIAEEKMRAESLIYKCFQVTLPTLPCNQLPYLQSTSVGEKSAFPRLANLLVSRRACLQLSCNVRNTVHSAFWPVEIHDKEWCYRWLWSVSNEVVILPLQFGIKIVLRMKSIYFTDKRTDVWSREFIIWKINSGKWAVVWAGLWNWLYMYHIPTYLSYLKSEKGHVGYYVLSEGGWINIPIEKKNH